MLVLPLQELTRLTSGEAILRLIRTICLSKLMQPLPQNFPIPRMLGTTNVFLFTLRPKYCSNKEHNRRQRLLV